MRKKPDKLVLENIKKLFLLAKKEVRERPWLAKRYVADARKIAKRQNLSLKKYRRKFCRKCGIYFVPGENCRVRISKGKISIKCLYCNNYVRYKFEKSKRR
ncbi:MAG: ribonuclease P [Candidatus Pacearchaeota archaeon]|nr:ribonuclease P [Candidatus Pacearchaeota archaeon]